MRSSSLSALSVVSGVVRTWQRTVRVSCAPLTIPIGELRVSDGLALERRDLESGDGASLLFKSLLLVTVMTVISLGQVASMSVFLDVSKNGFVIHPVIDSPLSLDFYSAGYSRRYKSSAITCRTEVLSCKF